MITIEDIKVLQDGVAEIETTLRAEHLRLSDRPDEGDPVLLADEKVSVAKMLHTASKTSRDLLELRLSAEWYYRLKEDGKSVK